MGVERHSSTTGAAAPRPASGGVEPHAAGARVLVVDDVDANRTVLIRRLQRLGITDVAEAADGQQALDRLAADAFDLVLLDIMMPVKTGFDVLADLAAQGRTGDPPVIVISALNEMDAIVRAIGLGAEDFLFKPFDPQLLRARVLSSLEKKRLRDAMAAELARKRLELAEARDLQLALVPPAFDGDGMAIDSLLEPAREVGGDLVDHFALPGGRRLLVIGDVSDKGAGPALTMARTHALVRSLAQGLDAAAPDLAGLVGRLNAMLCTGNASCLFVTALLAMFDPATGVLECVRCGHVPPFVRRAGGGVDRIGLATGLPLGVSEDARYTSGSARLGAGDILLFVSDGVTEAEDAAGTMFGDGGVVAWLTAGDGNAATLAAAVRAHEGERPASDDLAVLVLRFRE